MRISQNANNKNNLQNQSLKPQRWANHLSIKMNPWPWVINQRLNLDLKLYKKNKRWNSWPRVIHWKPNVNEFWPWVIIKRIKIRPWVENQDLILSHHQNSKNNKIDPESKIKSDPELKIQDQNCDPESMSSKHSS